MHVSLNDRVCSLISCFGKLYFFNSLLRNNSQGKKLHLFKYILKMCPTVYRSSQKILLLQFLCITLSIRFLLYLILNMCYIFIYCSTNCNL